MHFDKVSIDTLAKLGGVPPIRECCCYWPLGGPSGRYRRALMRLSAGDASNSRAALLASSSVDKPDLTV